MVGVSERRLPRYDVPSLPGQVRGLGNAEWDGATGLIRATVSVSVAGGASGTLKMSWYDWEQQPQALVRGTLDGHHVSHSFLAP